ncbi:hypothetical protein DYB35_000744, partial [Aphanomyces astaci]
MKVTAFAFASVAATKQSILTLTAEEKAVLGAELAKWEQDFGTQALARGLLPHTVRMESRRSEVDIHDEKLQRLMDTKFQADLAQIQNPNATFDWNNQFALLNEDEFKAFASTSLNQEGHVHSQIDNAEQEVTVSSTRASSVDWTSRCNPPVRSQGICGSCWAHAAVGVAEAAHCIATDQLLSLSVQEVTSCSTDGGSSGCNGGSPDHAITYVAKQGLCLDSAWTYNGQTGSCGRQCEKKKLSIGAVVQVSGESALVSALNSQPVTAFVESANNVWKNYKGGLVSQCPGAHSEHVVIVVGYDNESFKIKNSWGTNWGEEGYIRLRRGGGGKGMCNIADRI